MILTSYMKFLSSYKKIEVNVQNIESLVLELS